jgi:sec-independent protein translocase protein TatB
MFDIGFSELLVIGIVALVVIGPERLPKVARTAGHLLGRLQRYVAGVKADIAREMELDELRKFKSEMEGTARSIESTIQQEVSLAEQEMKALEQEAKKTIEATSSKPSQAETPDPHQKPAELVSQSTQSPQRDLVIDTDSAPNQRSPDVS